MGKIKTYLDINGQRYNADTGNVLSEKAASNQSNISRQPHKQVLDGVVVRQPYTKMSASVTRPLKHPKPHMKQTSHPKAPTSHRKTESTKTLMRQAVRKPSLSGLLHSNTNIANGSSTESVSIATWPGINHERAQRAKTVNKSTLISRFGSTGLLVRTAVLPVKHKDKLPQSKPSVKVQRDAVQTKAKKDDVFAQGLANATSHEQPKLKKSRLNHRIAHKLHIRPKMFNIGAAVLAAILLGGFILYQNLSNLTVRLASVKAGLHASLPSYSPSGFTLKGPVQYAPGQVTLNFHSNSDQRSFQVKQQASSWNSENLLQTYVAKNNQPYQTYQDEGRMVYIDKDSANLVTGTKWVQVKSDGTLSSNQMLNIVKSIH